MSYAPRKANHGESESSYPGSVAWLEVNIKGTDFFEISKPS